jgi:hypothetical protein
VGKVAVAVRLVVVAAVVGCAPAPRVEPIDGAAHETLPFVPFSPGAADAGPESAVDDRPAIVAREAANLVSDFEQPGAALVVRESEMSPAKLADALQTALTDEPRRQAMASALAQVAQPDAVLEIAKAIMRIAR